MSPYEEMQELNKQISAIHKNIANHYKNMSKLHGEYFWTGIERVIENEKGKAAELRTRLNDAQYRFVNWEVGKDGNN